MDGKNFVPVLHDREILGQTETVGDVRDFWYTLQRGYMRLSELQKYILMQGWNQGGRRFTREKITAFYAKLGSNAPSIGTQVKVITKSLERMIDKELLIGYGVRTPHKWFIKEIKLTAKGSKLAHKVISDQQQRLPLKTEK